MKCRKRQIARKKFPKKTFSDIFETFVPWQNMYKRQQIQFLPVGENLYWTQRDREYLEDILRRDKQILFWTSSSDADDGELCRCGNVSWCDDGCSIIVDILHQPSYISSYTVTFSYIVTLSYIIIAWLGIRARWFETFWFKILRPFEREERSHLNEP